VRLVVKKVIPMDFNALDQKADDNEQDAAIQKGVDYLQALGEEASTRLEPQWKSRVDILKTIISLCSGSVVLTVTFSAAFRSVVVGPFWRWLVIFSFGLLVSALLLAFTALWVGTRVYELPASLFTLNVRIPHLVETATSQLEFSKRFEEIMRDVFWAVEKSDVRARRLFKASCICFCVAMLLLAAVGFRQLSL
jgi:hypothetical protein